MSIRARASQQPERFSDDGVSTYPGRRVVLELTEAEAEALAAARIARAGSDLLAADAKPVAHAVADALVAAGMGND